MYKCIKGFSVDKCDDNGRTLENEYVTIEEDSNWFVPDEADYRFIGGDIRLEDLDGTWIEIPNEWLKEYFEKVYILGN